MQMARQRWLRGVVLILAWAGLRTAVAFSVLHWNLNGNDAPDWSTNAPQVQAIGRIVRHLNADILTLQEIPVPHTARMADFTRAFLPGFHLATNSASDGYIRSVVLSRYPIRRSRSWLDGASLAPFGSANTFTRDLFEAEVEVPGFAAPVHVFTAHLKNGSKVEAAKRRGAEAGAISNFLVNVFLPAHPNDPYLLTGDLNEDVQHPGANSRDALPRLANASTGLRLTRPVNPVTGSERTWSSRMPFLVVRYDYVLPGPSLYARLYRSEVFRPSELDPLPPDLAPGDEALTSDHLPVLMIFRSPNNGPFGLSIRGGPGEAPLTVSWPAWPGYTYQLLSSEDLRQWRAEAVFRPNGGSSARWIPATSVPARFFRVRRIP